MINPIILEDEKCVPILSKADKVLYNSTKKALEKMLGEYHSSRLLYKLCSICKLSEKILLTNYDVLNKSLYQVLPTAAGTILRQIKFEMLRHAVLMVPDLTVEDIQNHSLSITDILNLIRKEEILKFVHEIPSHEHIVFFYENENFRDKILSAFFDVNATSNSQNNPPKGFLSSKLSESNNCNYNLNADGNSKNNILYSESVDFQEQKSKSSLQEWYKFTFFK